MLPTGLIQGLEFLRDLSFDEAGALTAGGDRLVHHHKDIVFRAGEPASHFGLVLQGCYKLVRPGKADTLLSFAVRNDPIGLLLMADPNSVYPVTAQSIGTSQILLLPRALYFDVWMKRPEIVHRCLAAIRRRCGGFHADRGLQGLSLEGRIAGFLLRCLDEHPQEHTSTLGFPLSRRDVSEAVGAQLESVIRVMSRWEKLSMISTRAQFIDIVRPDLLAKRAEGEETPDAE